MPFTIRTNPTPNSISLVRKVRCVFLVFHVISLLIGFGMVILALLVRTLEMQVVQQLHLGMTQPIRTAYYVLGGSIVLTVIVGLVALFKKKTPYLWVIYCTILAFTVLITFAASGSALSFDISQVKKNFIILMQNYQDESRRGVVDRRTVELVDSFQEHYECCGVDSFKDWQDVEFGRTSLKVPKSCCKLLSKGKEMTSNLAKSHELSQEDLEKYDDCGLLCLPGHSEADKFLYTLGCFPRIFGTIELVISIMGWYGLCAGGIFTVGFLVSCYLIASKGF